MLTQTCQLGAQFRMVFRLPSTTPESSCLCPLLEEGPPGDGLRWGIHGNRGLQPYPVFLPGESQGRGSLEGCRLWGRTESDTTEAT